MSPERPWRAGLLLAMLPGACSDETPDPVPPSSPGGVATREVVHLIDRFDAGATLAGPLAEVALPQPIVTELAAHGEPGASPWRAELPWPAVAAAGIAVHAGGRALAPCSAEALRAGTEGFAFLPARRLYEAADIPGNPVAAHNPRRRRPSLHEYAQILFHDGSSVTATVEAPRSRAVLRLRARRGDVARCTLECTVGGSAPRRFALPEADWQVLEWEEELAPGPAELRIAAVSEEGRDNPKQVVATLQWLEVEFPGPDLLLLPGDSAAVTARYLPRFPGEHETLRGATEAGEEVGLYHAGGPLEVHASADLAWLDVDGTRFEEVGPERPATLQPAPGLLWLRAPGGAALHARMPWAPLLSYLADADGLLRDDLSDPASGEHGLRDRVLRRIASGFDRRTAFFLPTPSVLELRVDAAAGDRLRFAVGVADPPREPAASSSAGSAAQAEGEAVLLRVRWRAAPGQDPETLLEARGEPGGWKDLELPLPGGEGWLVFEMESLAGAAAVPAALADPRIVPPPEDLPRRANLLIYLVDTLRADALSCYGAENPTSPAIDAFAAQNYLFENFYAVASWTRPTTATLFTGVYPSQHGITREDRALPPGLVTLAEVLRHAGYSTWGALSNIQVSAPGVHFEQGFHRFVTPAGLGILDAHLQPDPASERLAECMVPWLRACGDEPFFLYLHSMDPHIPYLPAAPFAGAFTRGYQGPLEGVPLVGPMDLWSRIQELGTADFAYARGVYEEEVRGQDAAVGELLAVLDGMGLLEDTVVVLLADHGEEFYEHERFTHAGRMWEEQIHVPLVLSIPAWLRSDLVPPPQRFAAPVSQADFLPTILEVLGIPDAAPRQGRSFLDVLRGTRREEGLVYSFENERLGALRAGPLKLIWNDPADAAPGETAPELYHLGRDPGEKQNIAADHPGPVAELLARRRQLEEELRVRGGLPPQPSDVQFGEAEVEALRALGYLEEEPPPE